MGAKSAKAGGFVRDGDEVVKRKVSSAGSPRGPGPPVLRGPGEQGRAAPIDNVMGIDTMRLYVP